MNSWNPGAVKVLFVGAKGDFEAAGQPRGGISELPPGPWV
jgi:hypothetical protein